MKLQIALLLPTLGLLAATRLPSPTSAALASVVETERAFARMSVSEGRRAAFLAFFGDDALFFAPAPVNAREQIRKWPASGPFALDWEPRFGAVAAAGDLAYTTGPFLRTAPGDPLKVVGSGWFFTIWKKQADGRWKVAVDTGINSPGGAVRPAPFEATELETASKRNPGSLLSADRALCGSIASAGRGNAFAAAATDATRVYREGEVPIVGLAAIGTHFAAQQGSMICEPVKDVLSRSADLGYTYGKYSIAAPAPQTGYYLRLWASRGAAWKLAADLVIPGR